MGETNELYLSAYYSCLVAIKFVGVGNCSNDDGECAIHSLLHCASRVGLLIPVADHLQFHISTLR